METETKHDLGRGAFVEGKRDIALPVTITDTLLGQPERWVILAASELQALVQWAYDARGILAAPSIAAEAERALVIDAAGLDKIAAGEA